LTVLRVVWYTGEAHGGVGWAGGWPKVAVVGEVHPIEAAATWGGFVDGLRWMAAIVASWS
jgi:hypothetical protein